MNKKKDLKVFLTVLLFCCAIYFPLLGKRAKNPDARLTYPPLFEIGGPGEYLRMLSEFNVVDFQPVRDLTFFFDFAVFRWTGIVTFATTNVLLWAITVFLFLKLLEGSVSEERKKNAIWWALAFAAYPLFSQIVPWGMARKHMMAVPLLLLATHSLLDWMKTGHGLIKSSFAYALSLLSHPIGILWPCWAVIHVYLTDRDQLSRNRRKFIPFFLILITVMALNFAYYVNLNERVREIFLDTRPDFSNVPQVLLNFFFYLRQMCLPYFLTFQNYPDLSNAWPGGLVLLVLSALVYQERKNRKLLTWVFFGLMSFPVFVALPAVYDQYLLIPTIGTVLVLFVTFSDPKKMQAAVLVSLATFWGVLTFSHARLWTDDLSLAQRNFDNSPSCKSATEVLSYSYTEGKRAPIEALSFFIKSHCLNASVGLPPIRRIQYIQVESMMLFYEGEYFPDDVRLERLRKLGLFHYYPQLIQAALLAQKDRPKEVEEISENVFAQTSGTRLETETIIENVLRPYCLKNNLTTCLKITEPYAPKIPYL